MLDYDKPELVGDEWVSTELQQNTQKGKVA